MPSEDPYQALFSDEWHGLAPGVRRSLCVPLTATGSLSVFRASQGIAGRLGRLMKLPESGEDVPVTLQLEQEGRNVKWTRVFGSMPLTTIQTVRNKAFIERTGPFLLVFVVGVEGESIRFRQIGLRVLGIPVPIWMGPRVQGRAQPGPDDQSWHIEVDIRHDWFGDVCRYHGMMRAE